MNAPAQPAPDDSAELTPLMVDTKKAAAMLGISPRMFSSMNSTGRVPRPVRLGRRVLWRVSELKAWVDAGCPPRERWEADEDGVWRAKPGLGGNRPFPSNRA